jgi:hypothetical protein
MTFFIEQIKIKLTEGQYALQLTTADDKLFLPGQTFSETINLNRYNQC